MIPVSSYQKLSHNISLLCPNLSPPYCWILFPFESMWIWILLENWGKRKLFNDLYYSMFYIYNIYFQRIFVYIMVPNLLNSITKTMVSAICIMSPLCWELGEVELYRRCMWYEGTVNSVGYHVCLENVYIQRRELFAWICKQWFKISCNAAIWLC